MSNGLAKAQGRFSETEIDSEIVVMSLETGDFFSLTGTAREVWLLLDGTLDRAGLIGALAADYDSDAAAVAADVDGFLAELAAAGLLAGE
jgi:pyrroloquinoline quinone biosynthesis protein D